MAVILDYQFSYQGYDIEGICCETDVEPDLCYHKVSLGHHELNPAGNNPAVEQIKMKGSNFLKT